MKVIFLDIDGVLNVRRTSRDRFGSHFHQPLVNNLASIVEATDAKIVISSSWRHDGLEAMQAMWKQRKLPGEVIDVTDSIRLQRGMICVNKEITKQKALEYPGYSIPRGCEIDYWLRRVAKLHFISWSRIDQYENINKSPIKGYVIIDDDTDFLWDQRSHFVRCSGRDNEKDSHGGLGLTKVAAQEAITILNTDLIDLYYK